MLNYSLVQVQDLTPAAKDIMFSLLDEHFCACARARFERDLAEKHGVILLTDIAGQIRGYSTYLFLDLDYNGEPVSVLFSGDTIVERQCWGDSALFKGFFALLLRRMQLNHGRRFFWFLISKGIRTYLILPLFFREFYPQYKTPTPPAMRALLDLLGEKKFGADYVKASGIVVSQGDFLNRETAVIPDGKLNNPHVRFFLERNPNWIRGDELACIAEIGEFNFKGIVGRLMDSVVL